MSAVLPLPGDGGEGPNVAGVVETVALHPPLGDARLPDALMMGEASVYAFRPRASANRLLSFSSVLPSSWLLLRPCCRCKCMDTCGRSRHTQAGVDQRGRTQVHVPSVSAESHTEASTALGRMYMRQLSWTVFTLSFR